MLDDSSQNGAVACWVPGGPGHSSPPAGGSCDASWGSAFPSVVCETATAAPAIFQRGRLTQPLLPTDAQFKWQGDVLAPLKRWEGVTRFVDNEYSRTKTTGKVRGIKNIFAGLGDWVSAPNSTDNPAFVAEPKLDSKASAGFSFIRDVAHVAEMAAALGKTEDAAKYSKMHAEVLAEWHEAWYNAEAGYYADGGQTAQVLALTIDAAPSPAIKQKVVEHLVANIAEHDNHTTTGIIGWRFQPAALSANGHAELAYALMTQRTYPSVGYEIIGKTGEPATTLWELWDGDAEGPGMNSRNHVRTARLLVACPVLTACFAADHVRRKRRVAAHLRRRHRQRPRLHRLRAPAHPPARRPDQGRHGRV